MSDALPIRPAGPGDAQGIATVSVETWRTAYRHLLPEEVLASLSVERRTEAYRRILESETDPFFVADSGGHIIAFAVGGPERTGDPEHTSELYAIYCLESHAGQGIGRRLVAEVAFQLRTLGHRSMLVWVLRDNPSRAFYEALGGRPVRERSIKIAGQELPEVAYGWPDIEHLTTTGR